MPGIAVIFGVLLAGAAAQHVYYRMHPRSSEPARQPIPRDAGPSGDTSMDVTTHEGAMVDESAHNKESLFRKSTRLLKTKFMGTRGKQGVYEKVSTTTKNPFTIEGDEEEEEVGFEEDVKL